MLEEPLYNALVLLVQSLMIVADTVFERVLQPGVGDVLQMRFQFRFLYMQEATGLVVSTAVSDEVICSQAALATRGNEDDGRLIRRLLHDGQICRLGHSDHQRREVWDLEALQVNIHIQRTSAVAGVSMSMANADEDGPWGEIEDGMRRRTHPFAKVPRIRQRDTAGYDASLHVRLRRDIAGARNYDFISRPNLPANKLHFVGDEKADCLYVLPLPPTPR